MHPHQIRVTPRLVRRLVDAQFPAWSDRRITAVSSHGTVNVLFRIGDDLVARFPLQPSGAPDGGRTALAAEAAAARELAGRTRFATPRPVAIGEPGPGYPHAWAVQSWLPGTTAVEADPSGPSGSVAFAHDLAELIAGLRSVDVAGRTFAGSGRGGDLRAHDEWMAECFDRSSAMLDVPRLRALWTRLRDLPSSPGADVMSHGDLMPGNMLVSAGRLTGVLDVGGFGPADAALDLVGAWHLLDTVPRREFRTQLGVDDVTWERGIAWALEQAMGLVWYYEHSNPTMSAIGRRTLDRILDAT